MTTGTLTSLGQHDWLSMTLDADQGYLFTIAGLSEYAFALAGPATELSDEDLSGQEALTGGTIATNTLFYEPTVTGTYFIDLAGDGTTGTFTVTGTAVATDYADNSTTSGQVVIGGSATTGTLASPGQHDWLAVSLTANHAYLFTVTGLSVYADVEVGPASGLDDSVTYSNHFITSGTTTTSLVFFEPSASGTYYIDVSNDGTIGSYAITANSVTVDYTDNSSTTGRVAIGGAAITGTLATPGQQDWLAVTLTADQGYLFTISGLNQGADISVGPSDRLGSTIASRSFFGGTAELNQVFYEPGTTGTYFVDIDNGDQTGSYSISATTVTTDYSDNLSTTGTVAIGGTATQGDLATVGQHDWLEVTLTAGQAYDFTLSGVNGEGAFKIGPASGLDDSVLTSSESFAPNLVESISAFYEPAATGTYFLDISGNYDNIGTYSVSGVQVTPDYADNVTTKGSVAIGGAATTGDLAYIGQHDWLAATLQANQGYEFTLTGLIEPSVEIGPAHDLDDSVLTAYSSYDFGTPQTDYVFYEPAASGTYYLDISNFEDTGTYSISGAAVQTDYRDNPTTTASVATPCFAAGTRIATTRGEVAVEDLRRGDHVCLRRGGSAPIKWLGSRSVRDLQRTGVRPIQVRAHAFGPGQPRRDLLLSPDHAVFAAGVLIPVRFLVNHRSIIEDRRDAVTYWHVELDRHDILLAEGLACESYLDTGNRRAFIAGAPDLARGPGSEWTWAASACAPLRIAGAPVERIIARLRRRAGLPAAVLVSRRPSAPVTDLARLLQPDWYLAAYPDVAASGLDAATHYARWGRGEGRLPCPDADLLRAMGLVDPASIAAGMQDVVLAGLDPVAHFCAFGWRERRRPNPYFDTGWYLDRYALPENTNPLLHYLLVGEPAGLPPSRHFDPAWYRTRYRIGPMRSPLAHYLKHRGRQCFSPLPSFDVDAYRRAHGDANDPYAHFLAIGQYEGVRLAA